ncbi:MAG: beta-propeller domain-containing protein [Propionibacteriaceae bacterium]|jgi:uncharacterized secreted protein with C-terminal beta-propeller domain|nr:beta-propeller domain-containing protein [Propionibacteriaceae bacterium]
MSDDIFAKMAEQMKPSDSVKTDLFALLDAGDALAGKTANVTEIEAGRGKKKANKSQIAIWVSAAACVFAVTTLSIGLGQFGTAYNSSGGVPEMPEIAPARSPQPAPTNSAQVALAGDYSDIYKAVAAAVMRFGNALGGDVIRQSSDVGSIKDMWGLAPDQAAMPAPAAESISDSASSGAYTSAGAGVNSDGYSKTNVQVAGIDEGDVVKTDGKSIFAASGKQVRIISAKGASSKEIAKIDTPKTAADGDPKSEGTLGAISDMMLFDSTLVLLVNEYSPRLGVLDQNRNGEPAYVPYDANKTYAFLYDISDPAKPSYLSSFGQSGSLVTSRLLDNVLYLVSDYTIYDPAVPAQPRTFVPAITDMGAEKPLIPADISIFKNANGPRYAVASAIDLVSQKRLGQQAILGGSETVYMSGGSLYLGATDYEGKLTDKEAKAANVDKKSVNTVTQLARINLNGGKLEVAATANIPGAAINQFAFDEYSGNFRIVTTVPSTSTVDHIYQDQAALFVLNQDLKVVGSIPALVKNEEVKSVRFDKAVAYVVTFERVDPLFAIDLSNPKKPKVMSALKIPGFSSYMQPWSDKLLVGFGVEGDNFGNTYGLKLSLFDISDPYDVTESAKTRISGDFAEALTEHKAILFSPEQNLIGFATVSWGNTTPEWSYQLYSLDAEKGFKLRKELPISPADANPSYFDPASSPVRGLTIGKELYVCTAGSIGVYSLGSFDKKTSVKLS